MQSFDQLFVPSRPYVSLSSFSVLLVYGDPSGALKAFLQSTDPPTLFDYDLRLQPSCPASEIERSPTPVRITTLSHTANDDSDTNITLDEDDDLPTLEEIFGQRPIPGKIVDLTIDSYHNLQELSTSPPATNLSTHAGSEIISSRPSPSINESLGGGGWKALYIMNEQQTETGFKYEVTFGKSQDMRTVWQTTADTDSKLLKNFKVKERFRRHKARAKTK